MEAKYTPRGPKIDFPKITSKGEQRKSELKFQGLVRSKGFELRRKYPDSLSLGVEENDDYAEEFTWLIEHGWALKYQPEPDGPWRYMYTDRWIKLLAGVLTAKGKLTEAAVADICRRIASNFILVEKEAEAIVIDLKWAGVLGTDPGPNGVGFVFSNVKEIGPMPAAATTMQAMEGVEAVKTNTKPAPRTKATKAKAKKNSPPKNSPPPPEAKPPRNPRKTPLGKNDVIRMPVSQGEGKKTVNKLYEVFPKCALGPDDEKLIGSWHTITRALKRSPSTGTILLDYTYEDRAVVMSAGERLVSMMVVIPPEPPSSGGISTEERKRSAVTPAAISKACSLESAVVEYYLKYLEEHGFVVKVPTRNRKYLRSGTMLIGGRIHNNIRRPNVYILERPVEEPVHVKGDFGFDEESKDDTVLGDDTVLEAANVSEEPSKDDTGRGDVGVRLPPQLNRALDALARYLNTAEKFLRSSSKA